MRKRWLAEVQIQSWGGELDDLLKVREGCGTGSDVSIERYVIWSALVRLSLLLLLLQMRDQLAHVLELLQDIALRGT